jgi:hypothetical protein
VLTVVEATDDRPALGEVMELTERAEVAQESSGRVCVVEAE